MAHLTNLNIMIFWQLFGPVWYHNNQYDIVAHLTKWEWHVCMWIQFSWPLDTCAALVAAVEIPGHPGWLDLHSDCKEPSTFISEKQQWGGRWDGDEEVGWGTCKCECPQNGWVGQLAICRQGPAVLPPCLPPAYVGSVGTWHWIRNTMWSLSSKVVLNGN